MAVKVQIIFYSLYGHVYHMAQAIADGAREVPGAQVEVMQVAETLPPAVLEKMGATQAKQAFAHVPIADPKRIAEADVLIFGSGTRFGSTTSQLQAFFDNTGGHWMNGALVGKVGGVFASTASQHGGQETTLISMQTFLFHQGMIVVGVPYAAQELLKLDEVSGGTPYGSTTITGPQGARMPSANELAIARFQGKHTTQIGAKLAAK